MLLVWYKYLKFTLKTEFPNYQLSNNIYDNDINHKCGFCFSKLLKSIFFSLAFMILSLSFLPYYQIGNNSNVITMYKNVTKIYFDEYSHSDLVNISSVVKIDTSEDCLCENTFAAFGQVLVMGAICLYLIGQCYDIKVANSKSNNGGSWCKWFSVLIGISLVILEIHYFAAKLAEYTDYAKKFNVKVKLTWDITAAIFVLVLTLGTIAGELYSEFKKNKRKKELTTGKSAGNANYLPMSDHEL